MSELKQCDYCKKGTELINTTDKKYEETYCGLWITKNNEFLIELTTPNEVFQNDIKINYCPMCGRKLRGEENG